MAEMIWGCVDRWAMMPEDSHPGEFSGLLGVLSYSPELEAGPLSCGPLPRVTWMSRRGGSWLPPRWEMQEEQKLQPFWLTWEAACHPSVLFHWSLRAAWQAIVRTRSVNAGRGQQGCLRDQLAWNLNKSSTFYIRKSNFKSTKSPVLFLLYELLNIKKQKNKNKKCLKKLIFCRFLWKQK